MANRTDWAAEAVRGIVSRKERERARQELLDHMEDHAEALMSTGLPRSRALEEACAAMGDPKEVGRYLRRVHQPILSALLILCRWAILALLVLLVLTGLLKVVREEEILPLWLCGDPVSPVLSPYGSLFDPDPRSGEQDGLLYRRVVEPEAASVPMGDYTVRPVKASIIDYNGTSVYVLLDFTAHHLWQDPPILEGTLSYATEGPWTEKEIYTLSERRNLNHHYVLLGVDSSLPPQEVTRLTLSFTNGEQEFTLSMSLEGGLVYEKVDQAGN